METSTVESFTDIEMGNYTATNVSITSTIEQNTTMIIILAASGGGSGGAGKGPQCFYWDLFVRILLNSALAVLGIIGNR